MTSEIELPTSKMQVRYRVVRLARTYEGDWNNEKLLYTSESYQGAESFCWAYDGGGTLEIRKVWVRK